MTTTTNLEKLAEVRRQQQETAAEKYARFVSSMADGESLTAASARSLAETMAGLAITDDQLKADVSLLKSYRKTVPLATTDPLTAEEREQLAERQAEFRKWQKRASSGWLQEQVRKAENAYLELSDRAHAQSAAQKRLHGLRRDGRLQELLSRLPDDETNE